LTTIIVSEDCGNSPKNIFLQNLTIAFASGDKGSILDGVTDDVRWRIIGGKLIQGKDAFAQALENLGDDTVEELTIHHVVSHGRAGAVNGISKLKNGNIVAFCEVYEFSGAKGTSVKNITSYVIEINQR
jgi:hypothetical protein